MPDKYIEKVQLRTEMTLAPHKYEQLLNKEEIEGQIQDLKEYVDNLPSGGGVTKHSQLTLDDGTNPHGTTKADVGLSDVPNVDLTAAVALNTAKETNIAHPLVETAVPLGAVFTDTIYDDTAIQAEVDLNTTKVGVQPNIIGVPELKPIFKDTQIIVITSGAITIDFSLAIVHYIHITENITAQTWNNYTLAKADWLCVTFADPTKTIGGFPAGVNTADLKAFNKTTPTTENWISVNTLKTSPPLFLLSNTVK